MRDDGRIFAEGCPGGAGGLKPRKGVTPMSLFEVVYLLISLAMLVLAFLNAKKQPLSRRKLVAVTFFEHPKNLTGSADRPNRSPSL
jgi:hypothetical protein